MTINKFSFYYLQRHMLLMPMICCYFFGTSAHALKVEELTLSELVDRADVICLAEVISTASPFHANIIKVYKNPANAMIAGEIEFTTISHREIDVPDLKKGDMKILFLEFTSEGKLECAAYGKQAIWPKKAEEWPYTSSHCASLQTTEKAVLALLKVNQASDPSVADFELTKLISSSTLLEKVVGLECFDRHRTKTDHPAAKEAARRLSGDSNPLVSRLALKATGDKQQQKIEHLPEK